MPPTRISATTADGPQPGDIDPLRYRHDDGVGPDAYFGERGHATKREAFEEWRRVRRDVWGMTRLFDVPAAATAYDGLTRESVTAIRHCCQLPTGLFTALEAANVRAALKRDRRRLDRFVARDEGAGVIADFLCTLSSCFDTVERLLAELVADFSATRSRVWRDMASAIDYDGTNHGRGTDAA